MLNYNKYIQLFFAIIFIVMAGNHVRAQIRVKGTVYDSLGIYPVQFVSVLSTSGRGTSTDADGNYSLELSETDSLWFSYLNKPTHKYAAKDIKAPYAFNISIKQYIPTLPAVKVKLKDYRRDSLANREQYAKVFDYQKPGLSLTNDGYAAGFDLDEIINAFRFKRNRRMLAFQSRLVNQEQDDFVKYKFNKSLIRRITKMDNDTIINEFIRIYQPSYLFTLRASDYAFHKYIKDSYERFNQGLLPPPLWREGETGGEQIIRY